MLIDEVRVCDQVLATIELPHKRSVNHAIEVEI